MKKIVSRLITLSLSALLAGCQTTRQNEKTWQRIGNVRPFFKNEKNLLPDRNGSKDNRNSENNDNKNQQKGKTPANK